MASSSRKKKKEEAEKLMEVAETKFKSDDINGAKDAAIRAKKLCPSLPGLNQCLAAYDVHLAAAAAPGGKVNWPAVLGIAGSEGVDAKAIKKQFYKMCKLTHPDKNPSAAADGAFKLVMEAFEILSKKTESSQENSKNNEENGSNGDDDLPDKDKDDCSSKKKEEKNPKFSNASSRKGEEKSGSSPPPTKAATSSGNPRTERKNRNQELARVECPRCGKLCKRRVIVDRHFIRCKHAVIHGEYARQYEYFFLVFSGDNFLYYPVKFDGSCSKKNNNNNKKEKNPNFSGPSSSKGEEKKGGSSPLSKAAPSTVNPRNEKNCNQELARVECPRCGKLCKRKLISGRLFICCKHVGIVGEDIRRHEYFYLVFTGENTLYYPVKFGGSYNNSNDNKNEEQNGGKTNGSSSPLAETVPSSDNRRTEKRNRNKTLARIECPRCGKLCKGRVIVNRLLISCKHVTIHGEDACRHEYFYVVVADEDTLYYPVKFCGSCSSENAGQVASNERSMEREDKNKTKCLTK